MKTFFALILLIATFAVAPSARAQTPEELEQRAAELRDDQRHGAELRAQAAEAELKRQELVNLEKETAHALQLNNTAFFRRVYSDEFLGVSPSGRLLDKTAFLTAVQSPATKYSSFVVSDIRIHMFQDSAVVTSTWSAIGKQDGRSISQQSRVTHVYVYTQRGWQAVSSQETILAG